MITTEEYLKAKKIVEEYEDPEYQLASIQSLYCTSCQALEAHDCFCEEEEYCSCGEPHPYHTNECLFKFKDEDDEI
jgi:hypothetical protein